MRSERSVVTRGRAQMYFRCYVQMIDAGGQVEGGQVERGLTRN